MNMLTALIILFIVHLLLCFKHRHPKGTEEKCWAVYFIFVSFILLELIVAIVYDDIKYPKDTGKINEPTALDVYRGKTELVVTDVTDNGNVICKDSMVIFKN